MRENHKHIFSVMGRLIFSIGIITLLGTTHCTALPCHLLESKVVNFDSVQCINSTPSSCYQDIPFALPDTFSSHLVTIESQIDFSEDAIEWEGLFLVYKRPEIEDNRGEGSQSSSVEAMKVQEPDLDVAAADKKKMVIHSLEGAVTEINSANDDLIKTLKRQLDITVFYSDFTSLQFVDDDVELQLYHCYEDTPVDMGTTSRSIDFDLNVISRSLQHTEQCNPSDGGDQWCREAISDRETDALMRQGTEIYCSKECLVRGALWCNIFGKGACRMCSDDCADFCGDDNLGCMCHQCPVDGVEKVSCTVGYDDTCYEQIRDTDKEALDRRGVKLSCQAECLRSGGLWCKAFGIDGCRFCADDCSEFCKTKSEEDCMCTQCSPASDTTAIATLPPAEIPPICTVGQDDTCYSEVVGCRFCSEDCSALCGEGVTECSTCYTCASK